MLTNKEKILVQHLLKHKEDFTTSLELAEILGCSDRTIRTYMRNISQELEVFSGVALVSKQGQGYQLQFEDEESIKKLAKQFSSADALFASQDTTDINDRHSYILNKLLLEQKNLYFDDLAEELFVSRSTLSSDFKRIRKVLEPYQLTIESKANKGVYVKGEEQQIRRFIMDYFFSNGFFQTLYHYVDEELVYGKINFEALTVIVLDECREAGLQLSDFVIQNLVVHLALAIRRLAEGFRISSIDDVVGPEHDTEICVASRIMDRISLATKLDFPEEEVAYIALHLISKGKLESDSYDTDQVSSIRQELSQALELIFADQALSVQQDFQLMEGLLTHLATLYLRSSSGITLDNPLLEDIKANYPQAFELAEKTLKAMPSFDDFTLSEDEIAYVALHFMAAQERFKDQLKFNVLVICATGYGSAQMLRSRIENELRQYVTISDVIGYYEITDEKLKGIDFIISSIDLSNLIFNIPVFTTSVFLKEDELIHIRHKIEQLEKTRQANQSHEQRTTGENLATLFESFFSPNYFYIEYSERANKESLLRQMVEQLSDREDDKFQVRLHEMMVQRERLSSVLFSEAIAVPHPIKPVSDELKVAVALIPNGLSWGDESDAVKLVFLPSISKGNNDGLKVITNAIVDLVDRPELVEALSQSQDFETFKRIFITELGGVNDES